MTTKEYRKKTIFILFKVLALLAVISTITILIFGGADMIILITVGAANGWLIYRVHMNMLYQLSIQYFREQDEETG